MSCAVVVYQDMMLHVFPIGSHFSLYVYLVLVASLHVYLGTCAVDKLVCVGGRAYDGRKKNRVILGDFFRLIFGDFSVFFRRFSVGRRGSPASPSPTGA